MISIFTIYSPDRKEILEKTIACLEDVIGYKQAQKILIVDGKSNIFPENWEVFEIEKQGYLHWKMAWSIAVTAMKYDIFWYLESDRIVSNNYLELVLSQFEEKTIYYPKNLYSLAEDVNIVQLKRLREYQKPKNLLIEDQRETIPKMEFKRNPISGNVLMGKKSYLESGGMDEKFYGWGFFDWDYFKTTYDLGFKFVQIDSIELHQKHAYAANKHNFNNINLCNAFIYANKWNFPLDKILYEIKWNYDLDTDNLDINKIRQIQSHQDFKNIMNQEINNKIIKKLQKALVLLTEKQDEKSLVKTQSVDNLQLLKDLLNSDEWPEAVNSNMICDFNSEEDKIDRGMGIIEIMIGDNLNNMKFLDYGCGEGYVALQANAKLSVGYDIRQTGNKEWENKINSTLLTTNFDRVKENGPYDVVLLYDVLDHIENENPIDVLKKVKELLAPNGLVYIRCHPWCSRSGGHLYDKINKAYVHLIFTKIELNEMGYTLTPNNKTLYPIKTYVDWFNAAGLKLISDIADTHPSEPFFKENEIIKNRIMDVYNRKSNEEFPEFQLEQKFRDYIVK